MNKKMLLAIGISLVLAGSVTAYAASGSAEEVGTQDSVSNGSATQTVCPREDCPNDGICPQDGTGCQYRLGWQEESQTVETGTADDEDASTGGTVADCPREDCPNGGICPQDGTGCQYRQGHHNGAQGHGQGACHRGENCPLGNACPRSEGN